MVQFTVLQRQVRYVHSLFPSCQSVTTLLYVLEGVSHLGSIVSRLTTQTSYFKGHFFFQEDMQYLTTSGHVGAESESEREA